MGVASGCGEQEAVWLVGVGGVYGCGCKEAYRFPHTLSYSSCICSFLQQQAYFLFILKMFFVLVPVLFVITFYNFLAQYKHHNYGQLRASHGSHMKAAHNVLCMKKHTQTYASYPVMDISCMTSRSVV